MTSLKISTPFLDWEWKPSEADKAAAWELYVERLTRVSTQGLRPEEGDEKAALASIHELFDLSREVIKRHQRDCIEFTKLAVVVLNQVIRPFTAQWHRKSLNGLLGNGEQQAFRADLAARAVQKSVVAEREGPDAGAAVFPVATRATRPAGSRRASGAAMPEASAGAGATEPPAVSSR